MGTFTLGTGLGMLAFGLVALAIGVTAFFVIVKPSNSINMFEVTRL